VRSFHTWPPSPPKQATLSRRREPQICSAFPSCAVDHCLAALPSILRAVDGPLALWQRLHCKIDGPRKDLRGSDDQIGARAAHLGARTRISISATSRRSCMSSSASSLPRWRAGDRIELRDFGSFGVKNRPAAPAAIRALARTSRSKRRPCRSSGPARKCASGSTARGRPETMPR
jgi:hypothetical protein